MNKFKNKISMEQFWLDIGVMLNLVQHLVLFSEILKSKILSQAQDLVQDDGLSLKKAYIEVGATLVAQKGAKPPLPRVWATRPVTSFSPNYLEVTYVCPNDFFQIEGRKNARAARPLQ